MNGSEVLPFSRLWTASLLWALEKEGYGRFGLFDLEFKAELECLRRSISGTAIVTFRLARGVEEEEDEP